MKARPLLMKEPLVLGSLRGDKTQTRRVMKVQPPGEDWQLVRCMSTTGPKEHEGKLHWARLDEQRLRVLESDDRHFVCPYGMPGDLLFVRETWCEQWLRDGVGGTSTRARYKADGYTPQPGMRWKPSIHMPRWASRLTLRITDVRAQRLQEISREDAVAEGLEQRGGPGFEHQVPTYHVGNEFHCLYPVTVYQRLWDSINAKPKSVYARVDGRRAITHYESYPWSGEQRTETHRGRPHYIYPNPRVWAITYEAIAANVDQVLSEAA